MSAFLNPQQRQAVAYLDGPCLVLAGAGSGKTRVITQKIAYLIEHGHYPAAQIAALTFTNKAASEMQERVAALLENSQQPKPRLRGLTICTFHSLGVQILRKEAQHLGLKPRFSLLAADDSQAILQDLIAATGQFGDRQQIRRVQTQISLWKNGLVTPEEALHQASNQNQAHAARIYHAYAATLKAYQAVDFDDLIGKPVELFSTQPEVLYRWQSRLRYLLVDEVQDTNASQYTLLQQLVGERCAFTAVGDDDQAIYAWRGATLDNLRRIMSDYAQLKLIKLEQNYRSTGRILNAANALITHNPKLFEKKLWSEHGPGDALQVSMMNSDEHEAESVAIKLSVHKFERRTQYKDYAILYRSNHQARVFEQALRKEKIPYVLSGGQSFFERAEIKDLCAWLRLIANQDDDPALIRAVTTPKRGIGASTLETLGAYAGQRHLSLFAAACEAVKLDGVALKIQARQLETLSEFTSFVNRMEWRANKEPAGQVLDDLVRAIGYETWLYESHDKYVAQNKWKNIVDFTTWIKQKSEEESKSLVDLTQTIALINLLDRRDEDVDAVQLSTLHAAKGLEFPHVFLVGVEEGLLPHKGDEDDDPQQHGARIEEERRLMYVGITRAQRSLHISWCKKRKRAREQQPCEPSRFIAELSLDQHQAATSTAQEPVAMSTQQRLAGLKALLNKPLAKP